MFFIGIFGIDQKNKVIYTYRNTVCPSCSSFGSYDVILSYRYFHFFFIPLYKWGRSYFIKTHCCNKLCALDYDIGFRIEKGEQVEINTEHIHCHNQYANKNFCSNCSSEVDPTFQYCPYCGNKI